MDEQAQEDQPLSILPVCWSSQRPCPALSPLALCCQSAVTFQAWHSRVDHVSFEPLKARLFAASPSLGWAGLGQRKQVAPKANLWPTNSLSIVLCCVGG